MKIIYHIKCNKYRTFKNPKISYDVDKKLHVSNICDKCGSNDERIIKEEKPMEILKIFGLINNINA